MSTFIVGDELHFMGYRVAILTGDAPPTVIGTFEDQINNGTLFEEDKWKCSECNEEARLTHLGDCSHYKPAEKNGPGQLTTERVESNAYDDAIDDVLQVANEYARGGLLTLKDLATLCKKLKEEDA